MTDNVYLVTGATDGIGRATAQALALSGAQVILHGRNADKLLATLEEISEASQNDKLHTVQADFASLAQVATLADQVRRDFPHLNVLVNNAGVLTDHRQESADGFELTFAVNYLAPMLLTLKLLDTLRNNVPARIVNVASTAMGGGVVDFNNLQLTQGFEGWQAYANSKLMNVLFSNVLAGQLAGSGVVSNALCPGLIDSNFFHTNRVFEHSYERMKSSMRSPQEGALVPLYLASEPAAAEISGAFFIRDVYGDVQGKGGAEVRRLELQWNRQTARQLWQHSQELLQRWL
jgi:NAD(P)-dependent dehydrogenase (short-subunit alcohol dehydrogenase family)